MTKEEAVKEVEKAFEPAFANYIITALTEGATVSDKEPTTKNNRGVDCSLDDFIKYCKRTFGVELTVKKSDNPDTYAKLFGTTKNDLEVDWESYKDVDGNSLDDLILEVLQNNFDCGNTYGYKVADEIIGLLPSVTLQEPFKPMVEIDLYSVIKQKYIEREVLNKIKSEIDGLTYYWYEVHPRDVIDDVLEIIDKYKSESEVNNGTDSN